MAASIELKCRECGAAIPADAPAGQCVRCALNLLLDPSEAQEETNAGRNLGSYELLEKLGDGGMGCVWKARHRQLGRLAALKQIKAGFLASEIETARFRAEMETVSSLDHPNIVPIYEVGEADGQLYYAMKLVECGTVADLLARISSPSPPSGERVGVRHVADNEASVSHKRSSAPPIDPRACAQIVQKVARAVHYAHQRGVIHRDLKPSNILLDAAGEPYLADFGLAKRLTAENSFTVSHAIMGSVHYLSPEQALGQSRQVTTATDIYGLGVILYELLAGRPPFEAETIPAVLRRIAEEEPLPPSELCSSRREEAHSSGATIDRQSLVTSSATRIDRDLETICLKCLAKNPARRYATAEALAEDLERWLRREPILARPPTPWERMIHSVRRHPVRFGLAAVALLAVLLVATFLYARQQTYYRLMAKIADEHLIVAPREDATFLLHFTDETGPRCSYNFWKMPFGSYYNRRIQNGRYARLVLDSISPEVANTLNVRLRGDIPDYADSIRTPDLTNGSIFFLDIGQRRERAYYFEEINFAASNILARFPDAAFRIVLLGRPGDPDPYRPAGALEPRERP